MKKIEQAGAGANHTPDMSSYTATNVLHRTLKNTPANENQIRGVVLYPEDIPLAKKLIGESRYENAVRKGGIIEAV